MECMRGRTTLRTTLDNAEVLTNEPNWTKRKVKEALYIKRTDKTLNLDQGYQLDTVWHLSSM